MGDPLCDSGAESQQLDLEPRSVVLIGVLANKLTTITTTIIHCIITFVGSYYNKDFHFPTNVINPCKHNSYYICGKSHVTFVVGSGYYACGKCTIFVGLLH